MKKSIKKIITLAIATTTILGVYSIGASAEWRQDSTGWWYADGSSWYTGWKNVDGKWYYFNSDGYMAHDTVIEGYKLGSDGAWIINSNNNTSTNTNNTSSSTGTVLINDVGEINPAMPKDYSKYLNTKMTIFYNKSTGKVDVMASGALDLNSQKYNPRKDTLNYVVVDYNMNILFNPDGLYVENGKLIKK
jgi:hypothetical protein